VPRLSHEHVTQTIGFLAEFVGMLADLGLSALRLEQEREALRASEALYRSILSASPDDITITDLEGLVRMVSPTAVATFGCEREEEMVGRSLTEFLAPEDRERAQADVALMQQGAFTGPGDYRGLRADGGTFAIEANAEFVHDADEQPTGMVFIVRDSGAHKSPEEAVTRQSEQLRLLYEASQRLSSTLDLDDIYQTICDFMAIIAPNYGFFISAFDHETQLITCHACWMEGRWLDVGSFPPIPLEEEGRGTQSIVIRTGRPLLINDYQAQQQTAQSIFYIDAETGEVSSEAIPDEDVTRSALIVPLTIGGVVRGVIQVMSYRPDAYTADQLRLLEALALHIASAEQNALLYAQVQTELNERTQAEEHLAAAAGQWRQTFDAMSDSVTLFGREGRVLRCNAATVAFTGRDADDIVGRRCFEVFHGTAAFHPDCPQRRALDSGQTETSTIEQDGRWLRVTFRPLNDAAGRPGGGVHVVSDVSELKHAEESLVESLATQRAITDGVIAALARTIEVRDPYTAGHQRRVSELGASMALGMGLSAERTEGVRVAGMLHDVGKINIPAEILSKPGRLTAMEFELIKGHARAGFEILEAIHFPWPVAQMTLQHHEREDGSGYPEGLNGEEILPEAHILAVADVVEAMASHRPYRPALGIAAALEEIRSGAGTRYNAAAVAACERVFASGFAFTEA
jgi:PAS domain S-box-containing protein